MRLRGVGVPRQRRFDRQCRDDRVRAAAVARLEDRSRLARRSVLAVAEHQQPARRREIAHLEVDVRQQVEDLGVVRALSQRARQPITRLPQAPGADVLAGTRDR
jgi:hypothetical protein